jgi:hypothetical protein
MKLTDKTKQNCTHICIEYDYESCKDSDQVDGEQVTWECDDCDEKGIHHFEFDYEDSNYMDDERFAKFERKIMRDPKGWTGYTKKELRRELRDYAESSGCDLTEDGFDEFDYLEMWLKESSICEHIDYDSEDVYINYDKLTLSQTCSLCGYMRDLIHSRIVEKEN